MVGRITVNMSACIVDDIRWEAFTPDGKYGRKLFRSPDHSLILKVSELGSSLVPESWVEGMTWPLLQALPAGRYVSFAPTLSCGTCSLGDSLYAWCIQPYILGLNAYTQRDHLPPSPYVRHVIAEARAMAASLGFSDSDLTFPGQYQYIKETGKCVCIDYGKLIK